MFDDNASQIMKIPWVEEEKAKSEPQGEQEVKQCSELNVWRNSLTPTGENPRWPWNPEAS